MFVYMSSHKYDSEKASDSRETTIVLSHTRDSNGYENEGQQDSNAGVVFFF